MKFLLLPVFISYLLHVQSLELLPKKWEGANASVNCEFLTQGPRFYLPTEPKSDDCRGFRYRVNFIVHEIYYSLMIEKLSFGGIECMDISLEDSWFYSTFKIGDLLGIRGELASMEFIEWKSVDSFQFRIYKREFLVKILEEGKLQFTEL